MQTFFQSLSLGSAALLVAVVSAVLALLIGRMCSAVGRWCAAVLLPLILAYCVYWIPVWLGANPSEYSAWEAVGVGILSLGGLVASVLVTFIVARYAKRQA